MELPRRWRFRLVLFLVRIWRRCELLRLYPPEPVRLKRFAAPLLLFCLLDTVFSPVGPNNESRLIVRLRLG